jgi:uncharacterized membrane protein YtjA (UPF0391 family)
MTRSTFRDWAQVLLFPMRRRFRRPAERRHPATSINPAIQRWEAFMLRYAAIFFIIAIIAAVFGFGGIAAGAAEIAKVLFFIFLVIFLVTLLMGVIRR